MNKSNFMEEIDTSYKILYEDNDIIAVDKSGNCPIHPGGIRFKNNSLLTQLEKDLEIKLYPVYRIDRETSGIVVFAKKKIYSKRFENRE
jgi:23S rRNA pseudouridine955/2504/2580 synthase